MEPGVTIRLFADDCVIYTPVKTVDEQTKLNKSLQNIVTWCKKWGMQINTQKTMCMTVTRKKEPLNFTYKLINTSLERVDSVKYLGVTITRSLKWDVHINNVCARAFKQLGFLRRKLATAPTSVKLTAYKTLVRPILEYGSIVWNPHQKYLNLALEKIQSRALRFIYAKYSRYDSVTALRTQAGIPTLAGRRRLACLKFLYLLYHDLINITKSDYLVPPGRHSSRTNHDKCIRPFFSRCSTLKYSFFPSTIDLWNSLPSDVICSQSVHSFMSALELHLESLSE